MYIQGIGIVSPWTGQGTEPLTKGEHFAFHDPEYSKWIDLQQIRRMSRVVTLSILEKEYRIDIFLNSCC